MERRRRRSPPRYQRYERHPQPNSSSCILRESRIRAESLQTITRVACRTSCCAALTKVRGPGFPPEQIEPAVSYALSYAAPEGCPSWAGFEHGTPEQTGRHPDNQPNPEKLPKDGQKMGPQLRQLGGPRDHHQ